MNARRDTGCVFAVLLLACAMVVAFAVRECELETDPSDATPSDATQ